MSIQTMVVPKEVLLSVNAELGIPVGTSIDIINESKVYDVYLQESVGKPAASKVDKRSLTQRDEIGSEVIIQGGSEEVWVWSPSGPVTLSVQVL